MTSNSAYFPADHRWRILLAIVLTLAAVGVALGLELALTRSQPSAASSSDRQQTPSAADVCGRTYYVRAC